MDDIQTQKGESESMDSPLFVASKPHFSDLLLDVKTEVGIRCIYPFGICNNQFNFKSLDYLNVSVLRMVFGFLDKYLSFAFTPVNLNLLKVNMHVKRRVKKEKF